MLTAPGADDDARQLWRTVAECVKMLNAISNMTVVVEGKVHMIGQLTVSGDASRLDIKEAREVSN